MSDEAYYATDLDEILRDITNAYVVLTPEDRADLLDRIRCALNTNVETEIRVVSGQREISLELLDDKVLSTNAIFRAAGAADVDALTAERLAGDVLSDRMAAAELREQIAACVEALAENYPEDVFPADGTSRDAISGTAMRHAYRNAARAIRHPCAEDDEKCRP